MEARFKIKRISVDGYKNLRNCEADFSDFNVLVGSNNSGKSNFLEIFMFTHAMIYGSDDFRKSIFEDGIAPRGGSILCYKDMEENGTCRPIKMDFLIESAINNHIWEVNYHFEIQSTFSGQAKNRKKSQIGFIEEELTLKDAKKTGRPVTLIRRNRNTMMVRSKANNLMTQKIGPFNSCMQIVPSIYPNVDRLYDGFSIAFGAIDKLVDTKVISLSPEDLREKIGSKSNLDDLKIGSFDLTNEVAKIAKDKNLFEELKNVLCQILDLEDVKLSSAQTSKKDNSQKKKVVYFLELKTRNQPYSLIDDFSDGTLMVTAILTCILSPNRKGFLIAIEEPENCLHPKALKTLISYLKQKSIDVQFIVTTHSPYLLNNVSPVDVIIARMKKAGSNFERIKNIRELRKRLSRGFISFGDLLYVDFAEEATG